METSDERIILIFTPEEEHAHASCDDGWDGCADGGAWSH